MRSTVRFAFRASAAFAFACFAHAAALAQGTVQVAIEEAKSAEMRRRAGEDAQRLASWELRLLEQRKAAPRQRDYDLTYAQIREDYRQLQLVNNDLARATSSGASDPKKVDKAVAEIRRRAARLKENMALPEPEKPAKPPRPQSGSERLDHLLITLDNLVMSFVNSPVFEQGKVVNVQMSMRARSDLEAIIEVSDRIRKVGERPKSPAQ